MPDYTCSAFLRAVLDASRTVTIVISGDGIVRFASRGIQDMLGYTSAWAEGRSILEYVHPEDVSRVVESLTLADEHHEIRYVPMKFRIKDAEDNWVDLDVLSANRLYDADVEGIVLNLQTSETRATYTEPVAAMANNAPHTEVMRLISQGIGRGGQVRRPSFFVPIDATDEAQIICSAPDHPISNALLSTIFELFVTKKLDKAEVAQAAELYSVNLSELNNEQVRLMERWGIAGLRFGAVSPNDAAGEVSDFLVSLDYTMPEHLWMDGIWSPAGIAQWQELMQLAGIALAQERNRKELQYAASHDTLTGLLNRGEFNTQLESMSDLENASVLFIDLDDFKKINDNFGHATGDLALSTIADRIKSLLPPDALACRMGGDEFVLVTPRTSDSASLANEMLQLFEEPFTHEFGGLRVSASIGVTRIRASETPEEATRRADAALLQAKQGGKHRLIIQE